MTPGILPPVPPLKPLKRISPSLFPVFRQCKLRATWSSSHVQTLLPLVPDARLGFVIHKILEKAKKGELYGEDGFFSAWTNYINQEENKMRCSWIEKHLVPLEKTAHNYELKKQQCVLMVQNLASIPSHSRAAAKSIQGAAHEVWLQTSDGKVGGYVDAIVQEDEGDVILEYKTGIIKESGHGSLHSEVRYDYQVQTKLYAALYNAMLGKWPISVELMGLDGVRRPIQFHYEECIRLLKEAVKLLDEINSLISNAERITAVLRRLASPSPDICRFCLYRPCCPSYWEKRGSDQREDWPHDARGKLKEIKTLKNGLILIKVISDTETIRVRGLHPDRHIALKTNQDEVSVFSMIPDKVAGSYREGHFTTIYAGDNNEFNSA